MKFVVTILFAKFEATDFSFEKSGGVYVLKRPCANNCCSSRYSLSKYTQPPKACTANSLSSAEVKPKVSSKKIKIGTSIGIKLSLRRCIKNAYFG